MNRYAPVELLRSSDDTSTFDCGAEQQTIWLRRYAILAQQAGTARVYIARRASGGGIAGYHALSAGSMSVDDAPIRLAKPTGRHPIPVIILTRLGVDLAGQGRGLGTALVRDAFLRAAAAASTIGVRAMLIHVETADAASFYQRLDPAFVPSPVEPLHLVLLMKDLHTAISKAAAR